MEKTDASIYMATEGEFSGWDDPDQIEMNSQVIGMTTVFGCVIYICGFCCGGFCLYKMRHRIPVEDDKDLNELEDRQMNMQFNDIYSPIDSNSNTSPGPGQRKKQKPQDAVVDFYNSGNSSSMNNASMRNSDKPLKEGFQFDPSKFDSSKNLPTQYTQHETPSTGFQKNQKFKSIIQDKRQSPRGSPGPFDKKQSLGGGGRGSPGPFDKKYSKGAPIDPQDYVFTEEVDDRNGNRSSLNMVEDAKREMSKEQWAREKQKLKEQKEQQAKKNRYQRKQSSKSKKDPFGLDDLTSPRSPNN